MELETDVVKISRISRIRQIRPIRPIMSDRHQFRADWNNYNGGIYFVTICSHEKRHIFGKIFDEAMILSKVGITARKCLTDIPKHHSAEVEIWNYVIMPNHIHILLYVGAQYIAPAGANVNTGCLKPPRHGEGCENDHFNSMLAIVIRTFKAAVTRSLRAQYIAPLQVWQRSFHDHIIRDRQAYENITNYIETNVENWANDCFYSNCPAGVRSMATSKTNATTDICNRKV